jgi:hypothetical protein
MSSVQRAGWHHVGELTHRLGDPAPCCLAVEIVVRGQLVSVRGAFLDSPVTKALEHQLGGTPDVDIGYHCALLRCRSFSHRLRPIEHVNDAQSGVPNPIVEPIDSAPEDH